MGAFQDLTGQRFGRLVILGISHRDKRGHIHWLVRCDCHTNTASQKTVIGGALRRGASQSCGCWQREQASKAGSLNKKHGHARRRNGSKRSYEYVCWTAMIQRCHNKNAKDYARYGARGIMVFDPWHVFEVFLAYLIATIGPRPSPRHSLDRINNDLGYFPGNLRWATWKEQRANQCKRTSIDQFSTAELEAELMKRRQRQVLEA